MKLIYKPSPNYRSPQSTSGIMKDLTYCLIAVTIFSSLYYTMAFGSNLGLRVVLMMITSVASALATEAIWCKVTKQEVIKGVLTSYGWVTAMILTLMSSIKVSYYALAVSTVIALVFGKLVFGGFGQNIFNPAAFGEAILMNTFAGSNRTDILTSATPAAAMKSYGWMTTGDTFSTMMTSKGCGSLGQMFVGWYPSAIGSTSALLILLCLAYLVYRKDIDWQASVFYIGTVFVLSLVIGLLHGQGIWYPIFQVLAGGVLFGGVFMLTDPVTSPVTILGRIVFAVGAACFTLIFRLRSNMPDGVLYSILLMNMLTPAIDKMLEGSQIKDIAKLKKRAIIAIACMALVTIGVGAIAKTQSAASTGNPASVNEFAAAIPESTISWEGTDYE